MPEVPTTTTLRPLNREGVYGFPSESVRTYDLGRNKYYATHCYVLLRVAACCCVLLRVAACCCVLLRVVVCCCMLLRVAEECCRVLLRVVSGVGMFGVVSGIPYRDVLAN